MAATASTYLGSRASSSLASKAKAVSFWARLLPSSALGARLLHKPLQEDGTTTQNHVPEGLESREGGAKKDYSWASRSNRNKKDTMELALLGVELAWDTSPFLSFQSFPFKMRTSVLCLFTIIIWKHTTHMVSQIYSWRGILPHDEIPWVSPILDLDDI